MSEAAPAARRAALSAERIVEAAIRLIDEHGLPALTMRRLGASLSVEAMSLYQYFPNKDALLSAVRSNLFLQIEGLPDPEAAPWAAQLRAIMLSTYRLAQRHPSFAPVLLHLPGNPASQMRRESDVTTLERAGFSREEAEAGLTGLVSYVIGFLYQVESAERAGRHRQLIDPETRDRAFSLGLEAFLAGLQARLDAAGR